MIAPAIGPPKRVKLPGPSDLVRTASIALCRGWSRRCLFGLFASVIAVATQEPACAGTLIPNGNPTHNGVENPALGVAPTAAGSSVALIPNPAVPIDPRDSEWLAPAFESTNQGYQNHPLDRWVYTFGTLFGDLRLVDYEAWANRAPSNIALGNQALPSTNLNGRGGAVFELLYQPEIVDPDPASVRWIQVISTNSPSERGTLVGVHQGGRTVYLDNAFPDPSEPQLLLPEPDPYIGHSTNPEFRFANGLGFLDRPFSDLTQAIDWEAQAFLTTQQDFTLPCASCALGLSSVLHSVTIYDGVQWGYMIPGQAIGRPGGESIAEPSAMTLLLGGVAGLLSLARPRAARGPAGREHFRRASGAGGRGVMAVGLPTR